MALAVTQEATQDTPCS